MLIKPLYDRLAKLERFTIEVKETVPDTKELKNFGKTPALFLLPVTSTGRPLGSDARPKQELEHEYAIAYVSRNKDIKIEEPDITTDRQMVMDALLGFSLDPDYSGFALKQSSIHSMTPTFIVWVETWVTKKTHRI